MSLNLNFNGNPEYTLNTSLVEEMISMYGVLTKYLITEKINIDSTVFGDYSHMKSNSSDIYDIYMLPENTEDWDMGSYAMTEFGSLNFSNIVLFVAKSAFDGISDLTNITGNLIVFPNNKVMEITDTDAVVPGVNNLFTYNDAKSVYKLSCKPYDFKLVNELENEDLAIPETNPDFDTLDKYFDELISINDAQDEEAEVIESVPSVLKDDDGDTIVDKPVVDKTEKSIWGDFE